MLVISPLQKGRNAGIGITTKFSRRHVQRCGGGGWQGEEGGEAWKGGEARDRQSVVKIEQPTQQSNRHNRQTTPALYVHSEVRATGPTRLA